MHGNHREWLQIYILGVQRQGENGAVWAVGVGLWRYSSINVCTYPGMTALEMKQMGAPEPLFFFLPGFHIAPQS